MVIHLDRLSWSPARDPLPASYLKELAALQAPHVQKARSDLAEAAGRLEEAARAKPRLAEWAAEEIAGLQKRLSRVEAALAQGDEAVLDAPQAMARLRQEAAGLESLLALRLRFERIRPAVQVGSAEDVVVALPAQWRRCCHGQAPSHCRPESACRSRWRAMRRRACRWWFSPASAT